MYEHFQPLTSIQPSHFVEWFSGADISAIWTKTVASGGTGVMDDSIDGGYKLSTSTDAAGEATISFNNVCEHYDEDNSVMIWTAKLSSITNMYARNGLTSHSANFVSSALCDSHSGLGSVFYMTTSAASSFNNTATTVTMDTNYHTFKIANISANSKLYIDGILEVTQTTQIPTIALAPVFFMRNLSTNDVSVSMTYLECYNTSVNSKSLYEQLSPLTQIAGQRVVETFSGAALQSDRWAFTQQGATATGAMHDEVDGGYRITTTAATNASGEIDFADKRHYDLADSTLIATIKYDDANFSRCKVAITIDGDITHFSSVGSYYSAGLQANENLSYLQTCESTSQSQTSTGLDPLSAYHNYKIVSNGTNLKLTVDGVLKVTKTTDKPTGAGQPYFGQWAPSATVTWGAINYLEAYNNLTTPGNNQSVYEMFNPLTTIAGSHFWDWFDGNDIDTDRWTLAGTATGSGMADAIDEGYFLQSTAYYHAAFNNKRAINFEDSVLISTMRAVTTDCVNYVGLSGDSTQVISATAMQRTMAQIQTTAGQFIKLNTCDGTTASESATDISSATDLDWYDFKIDVISSSSHKLYVNGILKLTKTTNLPTVKMQPLFGVWDLSAGTTEMRIRNIEAYNT